MLFSDQQNAPEQSIACVRRDYPEWRRGRQRYAVWTLAADCPQVRARMDRARMHLGTCLHDDYRRQAHVTLFVCGFTSELARFDDDFPASRLASQLAALQAFGASPFELQIGGLDSFASAPFLRVGDPHGRLEELRRILGKHSAEVRQSPYHPHLTVGLYAQALPRAELQRSLAAFGEDEPLPLRVEELHLSTYSAAELFGPLRTEQRIRLDRQYPPDSP